MTDAERTELLVKALHDMQAIADRACWLVAISLVEKKPAVSKRKLKKGMMNL